MSLCRCSPRVGLTGRALRRCLDRLLCLPEEKKKDDRGKSRSALEDLIDPPSFLSFSFLLLGTAQCALFLPDMGYLVPYSGSTVPDMGSDFPDMGYLVPYSEWVFPLFLVFLPDMG